MKKNNAGSLVYRNKLYTDRMIERIDRKEKKGQYTLEDRKVENAMTVQQDGTRVWSF